MHLEDMTFITKYIHLCIENMKNIAYKLVHIENILKVHKFCLWHQVTHLDSLDKVLSNVFLHVRHIRYESVNTMLKIQE